MAACSRGPVGEALSPGPTRPTERQRVSRDPKIRRPDRRDSRRSWQVDSERTNQKDLGPDRGNIWYFSEPAGYRPVEPGRPLRLHKESSKTSSAHETGERFHFGDSLCFWGLVARFYETW